MLQYCVLQSSLCSSLVCAKWVRPNPRSQGGCRGDDNYAGKKFCCSCCCCCCQVRPSTRFSCSGTLSVWQQRRRLRHPHPHLILSVAHGGLGAQPSSSKGEREEEEKKKKKKTVARSQVNSSSNSGIDQQRQEKNKRNTSSSTEEDKKARILESSEAYPMIRVFKNDLCRLEITGDAIPWQAIAAMAADGGLTAAEELAKGKSLMTIETLIPGRSADHSSISTKLVRTFDFGFVCICLLVSRWVAGWLAIISSTT